MQLTSHEASLPVLNAACAHSHLTSALSCSAWPRMSATRGPYTAARTWSMQTDDASLTFYSQRNNVGPQGVNAQKSHLCIACLEQGGAVAGAKRSEVALHSAELLRPPAVNAQALWAHKLHERRKQRKSCSSAPLNGQGVFGRASQQPQLR